MFWLGYVYPGGEVLILDTPSNPNCILLPFYQKQLWSHCGELYPHARARERDLREEEKCSTTRDRKATVLTTMVMGLNRKSWSLGGRLWWRITCDKTCPSRRDINGSASSRLGLCQVKSDVCFKLNWTFRFWHFENQIKPNFQFGSAWFVLTGLFRYFDFERKQRGVFV